MLFSISVLKFSQFAFLRFSAGGIFFIRGLLVSVTIIGMWSDSVTGSGSMVML